MEPVMNKSDVSKSKFLSLVLRHRPDTIGVTLDANGWIDVDVLLAALAAHGKRVERAELDRIVSENDKQRFAFSEDGVRVRANQGHSVEVDLALQPQMPPETLFHGTVEKFMMAIFREGLRKGRRHHVHLSGDRGTAAKVGERRGKPIILTVAAGEMHQAGHAFFLSGNGVWLVDEVPPAFIKRENS